MSFGINHYWTGIVVLCLIGITERMSAEDATFEIHPSIINIGDSFHVRCAVTVNMNGAFVIRKPDLQYCNWDCISDQCLIVNQTCNCDSQVVVQEECEQPTQSIEFQVDRADNTMDGDWGCYKGPYLQETINIQIFEQSSYPDITGNFNTTVGNNEHYQCHSTGGMPPAQFHWFIETKDEILNMTRNSDDEDGISTLQYTAKEKHNGGRIVCVVSQIVEKGNRTDSDVLNIMYGGEVSILLCGESKHYAVKGFPALLFCNLVKDGNPSVTSYQWERNLEVTMGQSYNISEVNLSHEGLYKCTGHNGITGGIVPSEVTLEVNYLPENITIDGDQSIVEGYNLTLTCNALAKPSTILYEWKKPNGGEHQGPVLDILNVGIEDVGDYTCTARSTIDYCGMNLTDEASDSMNIVVMHTPKGQPTAGPEDPVFSVDTNNTLLCDAVSLIQPGVPEITWVVWKRRGISIQNYSISDGNTDWDTFISANVTDREDYSCEVGNRIGSSTGSETIEVNVEAPSTFEVFESNGSVTNPIYNGTLSEDFVLTCIVSASNIEEVFLQHNKIKTNIDYFGYVNDTEHTCENGCSFGLQKAFKQDVHWKASDKIFRKCEDVVYYDGEYQCVTSSTTAGVTITDMSEVIQISTHYGAISLFEENTQLAEFGDANVTLHCAICANPKPSFQWYFNGSDSSFAIKDAISQNYTVVFANDSSFGNYYCEVQNYVISTTIEIQLLESGPAEKPFDLTLRDNVTSTSLTVHWNEGQSGNHPPVLYVVKIKNEYESDCSLEESFAQYASVNGTTTGIEGTEMHLIIEKLQPLASYCVHIHAENTKASNNRTDGYACQCGYLTSRIPNIYNFEIKAVTTNFIIVTWKYNLCDVSSSADVSVGLTFDYKELDHSNTKVFPVSGRISGTEEIAYISGEEFSESNAYMVIVNVYEGNNAYNTAIDGIKPLTFSPVGTNLSAGAISAIVLAVIFVILVLVCVFLLISGIMKVGFDFTSFRRSQNHVYERSGDAKNEESQYADIHVYANSGDGCDINDETSAYAEI